MTILKKLFSHQVTRSFFKSALCKEQPRKLRVDNNVQSTFHFYHSNKILEDYVSQSVNPTTLRQFIFFGRHMNTDRLLKSANWVRNELLIRLAHRIRDFQQLPFFIGTNPHIEHVYSLYWSAFENIRACPDIKTQEDNKEFCRLLKDLLEDGLLVLPRLAQGLSESATYYRSSAQKDLDLFLNRMLRSRISRRVLAEQHLALTEGCENEWDTSTGSDGYVGIIFMHCSASEIVERSKQLVYQHVHRYHSKEQDKSKVPPIDVQIHQQHHHLDSRYHNGRNEILFAYVPEQLEHILYELLDNAVRYTILNHGNKDKYPAIQVTVSGNDSDVFFRISDQGGGMCQQRYDCLWSYQSRAQMGDFNDFKQIQKVPASIDERASQATHHHLGIGLTMSRIYAEYWGGELQVMTMDGYGTDVYVRIPRLGTHIENLGIGQHNPVFYTNSSSSTSTSILKKKRIVNHNPKETLKSNAATNEQSAHGILKFSNGWSQSYMIRS